MQRADLARVTIQQAEIDALLEAPAFDLIPVRERRLASAKLGMDSHEALKSSEVQQICYALTVHYAEADTT